MPDAPESLCTEISARRHRGRITCAITERDRGTFEADGGFGEFLDRFVQRFGFPGLGEVWVGLPFERARSVVREVLHRDLAYHAEVMPEEMASILAGRFFSFFGPEVRCFTNGNLVLPDADPQEVPGSFVAQSEWTFDTGVVCFDARRIGILWVQDDD